jgi:lysophospholipase L1-like esterase
MSMIRSLIRAAGSLALAGVALSCDHEAEVLGPALADDIFLRYVAIGNSITAGMQASGINDATQRQSFAAMLALQMRTRYAYPSLAATGCPAPMIDWRTTARPTGAPACALRNPALATDILNNTAVPDAGTTEVNAPGTTIPPAPPPYHNTLTTLFLGGKTQIQRALEARPTFATIWIGNNDALSAATVGQIGGNAAFGARRLTSQTDFQTRYDQMIADLVAGAPDLQGGVLIGVVQVGAAPRFFPAAAFQDAGFRTGFGTLAGGAITVHPNCSTEPGASALVSFEILRAMQGAVHPRTIACGPTGVMLPYGELGDVFILEVGEQTTLFNAVRDYNNYIASKAGSIGFAYFDPNPTLLAERRAGGCIAVIPDLAAAANASPFGACVSSDGVHPAQAGQRLLANGLIGVINQEYETPLPAIP